MARRMKKNCNNCRATRTTIIGDMTFKGCMLGYKSDYVDGERRPLEICSKPRTMEQLAAYRFWRGAKCDGTTS